MTVIWLSKRGKKWDEPAMAVPCPSCNAEVGAACNWGGRTHGARSAVADSLGFAAEASAPLLEDQGL